jgi:hypothetical protein
MYKNILVAVDGSEHALKACSSSWQFRAPDAGRLAGRNRL